MRRYAVKRDSNHAELTAYLQQCGWTVVDTAAVGPNAIPGWPDAIAVAYGAVVLCEFKASNRERLTDAEQQFRAGWPGEYRVLRSSDDVLAMTREFMGKSR